MRVILFSGKGGSGTSTVAAATACALAAAGRRTLGFGMGRGLGNALGARLGLKPSEVVRDLDVLEGHAGLNAPDEFRDWLERLLHFRGMDLELAEDLASLPGVNHIGRLLDLERLLSAGGHDAVVVDAAEMSQLLDLPGALDSASRWLDRIFTPRQQTVFEPFVRVFAGGYADAGDQVLETGRELLGRLVKLRDMLTDPEITSVRLVIVPDNGALHDLQEAMAVLSLFGYSVDAVVMSRVWPPDAAAPLLAESIREQQQVLQTVGSIRRLPAVLQARAASEPPRSPELLLSLAAIVYGEHDPAAFLARPEEHGITRESDHYVLSLALPFASRDALRLEEVDEGIAVHLNGRKCVITIPRDVLYSSATNWTYEGDVLRIILDR
jgi:arsenite-transporting ATPase